MTHQVYVDRELTPWLLEIAAIRHSRLPQDYSSVSLRPQDGASYSRETYSDGFLPLSVWMPAANAGPIGIAYQQDLRLCATTLGLYAEISQGFYRLAWDVPASSTSIFQTYHNKGTTALYVNGSWVNFAHPQNIKHPSYLRVAPHTDFYNLAIPFGKNIDLVPINLVSDS